MYEALLNLDNADINFGTGGTLIMNIVLAFIMFGIALEIKVADFKNVFYKPKSLLVGLTSQLIVLPAVTFALAAIFHDVFPPSVGMGMILLAACPGGNMSNFFTSLAKGNTALSVSMTSINSAIAFITTPFNFAFWGTRYVKFISRQSSDLLQPLQISIPHMLLTLTLILIIPLALGMLLSHYRPKLSKKLVKPLKTFSLLAFIGILVVALANNVTNFINHITYIFVVVLIHYVAVVGAGYLLARIFRLNKPDRTAVTIETGIQNSGLGLGLMFNPRIFPAGTVTGGMLFIVAWWGIWHIIAGFILVGLFRLFPLKRKK